MDFQKGVILLATFLLFIVSSSSTSSKFSSWDVNSSLNDGLIEITILDKMKFVDYGGYPTLLRCWNGSVVGPNFYVNPGTIINYNIII